MKTRIVLFLLVAFMVAGCRKGETPLTGGYGGNVMRGQVLMATGGSPAGVEVRVTGTGMGMTLGEDGRFMFMGVPDGAELQFRRAADGIDARMRVEPSSVPVVVEVSASGVGSRRRGAGRSLEYEGLIKEKGAGSLIILTSHKTEVEVAVVDTTVIRKGNTTFTFDELLVGWRVHVKAAEISGVLTAREVKVQNTNDEEDSEGATMTANGLVVSKAGTTLVVRTAAHGDVTVQTDGSTIIKRRGTHITVDQIEEGWEINSQGTRVDETTLLARQIEVRGKNR